MISIKKINLGMILAVIYALQCEADNKQPTLFTPHSEEEEQVIYPEDTDRLTEQMFELELKSNRPLPEASCDKNSQSPFTIKNSINLLNRPSQTISTTPLPAQVLSKFTGSLFFSNDEIKKVINAQATAQKP